jgi:siroheme synthase-like protein
VSHAYPITLDLAGRTVAIIGGGRVAARKARALLEVGAGRIYCVATRFCDELPADLERVREPYQASHLDGASLVFAATDRPDVNEAVVRDAHARNLWVNRADVDEIEPGDFAVPANLRRGQIVITVSAESPALAAMVRDRLEDLLDPRWEAMAEAMQELRPMIKSAGLPIESRRQIFRELASEEALILLGDRGADGLRRWLLARHPELNHA